MCEEVAPLIKNIFNLRVENFSRGKLTMSMKWQPHLQNDSEKKTISAGVLVAVSDHVGGLGAWTTLSREGLLISTIDLHVDVLSPFSFEDQGRLLSIVWYYFVDLFFSFILLFYV